LKDEHNFSNRKSLLELLRWDQATFCPKNWRKKKFLLLAAVVAFFHCFIFCSELCNGFLPLSLVSRQLVRKFHYLMQ
jgi:hypothetical protein